MQTPESVNLDMLALMSNLANEVTGDPDGPHNAGVNVQRELREKREALYEMKPVQEELLFRLSGENGTGGKPLKKKPENPYLEIDLIDPNDPVLFEGEVQKYKPGFKATYIDRWVQVTKKAFRYFVSKPSKDNPVIKPLLAIPVLGISQVQLVNYELPLKKGDHLAEQLSKHQFELFLEQDFVNFYLSHLYEKNFSPDGKRINTGIQYLEKIERQKNKYSPSKKSQMDMKEKFMKEEQDLLEEPLTYAAMNTLNTKEGAWTNREEMWILQDRRLLFATKSVAATTEWMEVLDQLIADKLRN